MDGTRSKIQLCRVRPRSSLLTLSTPAFNLSTCLSGGYGSSQPASLVGDTNVLEDGYFVVFGEGFCSQGGAIMKEAGRVVSCRSREREEAWRFAEKEWGRRFLAGRLSVTTEYGL